MNKNTRIISKVEVKSFLGKNDLVMNLRNDVNILLGENGTGKTLLLNLINSVVVTGLMPVETKAEYSIKHMKITYANGDVITYAEEIHKYSSKAAIILEEYTCFPIYDTSDFDYKFRKYIEKSIEAINKGYKGIVSIHMYPKEHPLRIYLDILESIFKCTNKTFAMIHEGSFFTRDFLTMLKDGKPTNKDSLSSGEKKILYILSTALFSNGEERVFILDSPEDMLSVNIQRLLIRHIREINPKLQLIIATHSPFIYSNYNDDEMSYIRDLITPSKA